MFGEEYFEHRLSDIYDLSIIPYLHGRGTLDLGDRDYEVSWELNMSIEGKVLLVITIEYPITDLDLFRENHTNSLNGTTTDEQWVISTQNLFFGDIKQSFGEQNYTRIFCFLQEPLILNKSKESVNCIDKIEGLITNFDFTFSNFSVMVNNREVSFSQVGERERIKSLLKTTRINKAVLSTISVPVLKSENVDEATKVLNNLCHFLSLLNINFNYCNLIKYYSKGMLVRQEITGKISISFHRNVIIDDCDIRNGLQNILENCYDNFVILHRDIDLAKFISMFSEMYEGNCIVEKRLAILILAYEYLLTKYLIEKGDLSTGEEKSIQDKIGLLNKYLRFIPKTLKGEDLRGEVRNKLFHIGHIPQMSFEEKWTTFTEYFDLLIQIILKILQYNGQYISRHTYRPENLL